MVFKIDQESDMFNSELADENATMVHKYLGII